MRASTLKLACLMGMASVATTACAQSNDLPTAHQNTMQSTQNSAAVSQVTDSHLRQVLTQAGIKANITSIVPSGLPNMYQVNLVGQPPLHITKDGKYVIQGALQKNPSQQAVGKPVSRSEPSQLGQPVSPAVKSALVANTSALKHISDQTPFFYTAVPGVIWGATLEGVPFLISDNAQFITDGEISVIKNGRFMGLDTTFEQRKNRAVLAALDTKELIQYPATSREKAVIYVADDVNCPYCRQFHQQIPTLNAKGVTVNVIGYPIYEQSPEQMRSIWCQGDAKRRRQAFDKAMLLGAMPSATASCDADNITPNRTIAAGLAIMATPAIYRADGVLYQANFARPEFLEFLGVD